MREGYSHELSLSRQGSWAAILESRGDSGRVIHILFFCGVGRLGCPPSGAQIEMKCRSGGSLAGSLQMAVGNEVQIRPTFPHK